TDVDGGCRRGEGHGERTGERCSQLLQDAKFLSQETRSKLDYRLFDTQSEGPAGPARRDERA
ncbi:MAG TPA: hypothetical protein VNI55_14230, partial [Gaiellaceae bacterium]|nr:hypothetical protein [Gaiellaceae bacterium]